MAKRKQRASVPKKGATTDEYGRRVLSEEQLSRRYRVGPEESTPEPAPTPQDEQTANDAEE